MRRHLPRIITLGFYLLILVFLGVYLASIDFARFQDISPAWVFLGIACVMGLAVRYWGAYTWTVLLRRLGAHDVRLSAPLAYVYAKSWMGRYIPGTAPWILGKIYFASQHGVSKTKLAVSSLLEAGLQIIVLLVVSAAMLVANPRLDVVSAGLKAAMGIVIVVGVICLIPAVFNRLLGLAFTVARRGTLPAEHRATTAAVGQGALLHTIGAIATGLSLFFIAKAVYPDLGYTQMLFVMGVGNLAGAAGMMAVFTPSGLGVRDGIQLVLLGLVMPTELAFVVTVATRLWGIVMDVAFFGIAAAIQRLRSGSTPAAAPPPTA